MKSSWEDPRLEGGGGDGVAWGQKLAEGETGAEILREVGNDRGGGDQGDEQLMERHVILFVTSETLTYFSPRGWAELA